MSVAVANPSTTLTKASDQEVIAFADAAIKQLESGDMVAKFQENVKQVGTWANQIDASFDRVSRSFADMVTKYGKDFPGFAAYNTEWIGYNTVSVSR